MSIEEALVWFDEQIDRAKVLPLWLRNDKEIEMMEVIKREVETKENSYENYWKNEALNSYMYLRDGEGYGAKRMERFIGYVEYMQETYNKGQFKLYDIMMQV